MKLTSYTIFLAIFLIILLASSIAPAKTAQDCSGRGESIEDLLMSTQFCHPPKGNKPEHLLLRPAHYYPSVYYPVGYYSPTHLMVGPAAYTPWISTIHGIAYSVNPMVHYQSHPPVIYAPELMGR